MKTNTSIIKNCSKTDLENLIKQYGTINEIAKVLDCDRHYISKKIKQFNIEYHIRNCNFNKYINTTHDNIQVISLEKPNFICKCLSCGTDNLKIDTDYFLHNNRTHLISCKNCGKPDRYQVRKQKDYFDVNWQFIKSRSSNAKNRGLSFNIDQKYLWDLYLKQDKKCFITQEPITFPNKCRIKLLRQDGNLSIDRINNNIGYEPDNIILAHLDFNLFHSYCNLDELFHFSGLIINPLLNTKPCYITDIPYWYWNRMQPGKHRTKIQTMKCELSKQNIIDQYNLQKGKCFYTGLPIHFPVKVSERGTQTASVDRIDSSQGYNKNNIVICHKMINQMKHSMSIERFKFIAQKTIENLPKLMQSY